MGIRKAVEVAVTTLVVVALTTCYGYAGGPWGPGSHGLGGQVPAPPCVGEGSWVWTRSPEQERRMSAALYNRYCIRCHGVDGRGVWDIPDVPNFADACWQDSRSDAYLAQVLHFGRGAVMPPFRGTLTYDEYYGLARHLRSFDPRRQAPRAVSVGGSASGAAAPVTAAARGPSRDESVATAAAVKLPPLPGDARPARRPPTVLEPSQPR